VIPNGVDSQLLVPLPKDECKGRLGLKGNVLGYVGSLEHWVDLETVVEAMPFLDAKLMVVGPGLFTDYGEKIKSLAERCGVADKMKFVGAVRYSELGRYISAMDIGLNPLKNMLKNQETVGGKVFNYLSCGIGPLIFLLHSTIPVNISIRTENTAISGELSTIHNE
jgi:glycosyltransferase involved in cell wall biosynthesis